MYADINRSFSRHEENEDGYRFTWIHGIRLDMLLLRDSGYRKRVQEIPFLVFERE